MKIDVLMRSPRGDIWGDLAKDCNGKPDGTVEYTLKCENIKWYRPLAYHDDYLAIDGFLEVLGDTHVTLLSKM